MHFHSDGVRASNERLQYGCPEGELGERIFRAAGDHLDLPEAVVDGGPDPDAWPRVTVMNDTAHGMVIWMSGACARTIALPPHSQNSVEICEGGYQIAGQITDGNFLPLVGEHDVLENGYQYTFTFYVQVNPYQTRTRRRR